MAVVLRKAGVLLGGGVVVAIASTTLLLLNQRPSCACGNPAMTLLKATNLAQQAHYREHGKLIAADDVVAEVDAIELLSDESRYRYRFDQLSVEGSAMSISYATTKDANFYPQIGPIKGKARPTYRSYVGAVVADAEAN